MIPHVVEIDAHTNTAGEQALLPTSEFMFAALATRGTKAYFFLDFSHNLKMPEDTLGACSLRDLVN